MQKMSKANAKVEELYQEYLELLNHKTAEQALAEFEYLHPITFSRLKKRIVDNSVEIVDNSESAS